MPVDFAANRKRAEQSGQIQGGDTFKVKEGRNVLRVLTVPLPHPGSYKGTRTFKWLCYVLDRDQGDVKLYFMPHTVYKALEAFQQSEDYGFEDMPMPYDVAVNAKGAGTKEVEYTVIAARKNIELTEAEQKMLAAKKPIAEVQDALFAKANEKQQDDQPEAHFDPDEIPV